MTPVFLQNEYVVLEPLSLEHGPALEMAAADGRLWTLWFTGVPAPGEADGYIEKALQGQREGTMLPFAIRDKTTDTVVGSSRFYDIVPDLPRVAIGYTWYAKSRQKGHLNTACKQLLLQHAFESLACVAVEFHTDHRNLDSQRAIERLGAHRDGVLRAHKRRPDGSLRNTVCYSIIASEWPDVDKWLALRLARLTS